MSASPVCTVVNVEQEPEAHPRTKLLRDAGYHVIEAATNEEACHMALQEGPTLLLLREESYERFRLLADRVPALMWMNGPDGCEFVNREYLAFLGVTDTNIRGYDWTDYVHPDDRKHYVTAYLEAVMERRLFEATFRFRRHDGEYRWMQSIGTPRFGMGGKYLGYVGSTVDITNTRSLEESVGNTEVGARPIARRPRRVGGRNANDTIWLNRRIVKQYVFAVVLTLLALLGRFALDPLLGDHLPYVTFFMAVAVTTWYGGLGASLTTVVLSGLAANWFFMSPRHTWVVAGVMQQVGYATYFTVSLVIVAFGQATRRTKKRAEIVMDGLRREIHERMRAEEQLASAKQRTETILESAGEAIFGLNLEGLSTFINPAGAEMFGYRVEDLLGKNVHEILHHSFPDGRAYPVCECPIYASLADGRMHRADDEIFWHKDGRPLAVSYTSTPVWKGDRLTGAVVVLRDVTERKQAADALRRSEQQLELLSNSVPALIFYLDRDRRYRTCNDAFTAWFGLTREQIIGLHVRELVGEAAWEIIRPRLDQAYAGENIEYETIAPYRRGGTRWIHAVYTPHRDTDGTVLGIVVLVMDITRSKQIEQTLRENEARLQAFANGLEQLVGERTEELVQSQARLRALATELNLAEQRERRRLATELHDHLQQTLVLGKLKLGQGKRLAQTMPAFADVIKRVDEVLSEALQYTRSLVADLSPPVLRDHGLSAGLQWLGEYMQKHDMAVRVIVPGQEAPKLPEDQVVLLFQSVRELLMNSWKHAGTGQATVTLEQHDDQLRITVRDEGAGFEPATTVAVVHSPKGGLSSKFGLFSIRERMKALGGLFEIESAPAHGTTATLILPVAARAEGDVASDERSGSDEVLFVRAMQSSPSTFPTEEIPLSEQPSRTRVLLVDDHAMMRQGLRSVLECYADLEVVGEAWNGEEAVKLVECLRPAVVIMDINMPKMNGIEATAEIKTRYPDITVIGLSVNAGGENQEAMLHAGASLLLTKEAAVEQLYGAIQERMQEREQRVAAPIPY
jgi:PAS domain S-box-containing protein